MINNSFLVKKKHINIRSGFTLIELLIYIALVAVVVGAVVQFAFMVIGSASKSSMQQEVTSQSRFVSEKLKYEIRNATGINSASSNFDVNLALNSAQQLSLIQTAPDNPILINVLNGKVQIKKGASAIVTLNSADTTVQDLTFSKYTSADNKTKNITFTLTLQTSSGSGRYEYADSVSLRSDAEIRSN